MRWQGNFQKICRYWHNNRCRAMFDRNARPIQGLYHAHGTSEQFHSEIKTDLDLERLPSGKFATNAIVLALGVFAYNLLRIISQESLKNNDYPPTAHKVKRRRVRTVIDRYISLAVKFVRHARAVFVKLNVDILGWLLFDECMLRFLRELAL